MKFKLIFITLLFLLTTTGYANYNRDILRVVRKDSSSVYVVSYSDIKPGRIVLTIKNNNGTTLVRRLIRNEKGFTMPINLSSVGEGKYTVQTDNGTEIQNIIIDYNNNTAPTYSRIVNLGERRYLFTSTHAGRETITIRIYNGGDILVFNEDREIQGAYSVIFNLKHVTGEPSFEVSEAAGHSLMVPGNPVITVVGKRKN